MLKAADKAVHKADRLSADRLGGRAHTATAGGATVSIHTATARVSIHAASLGRCCCVASPAIHNVIHAVIHTVIHTALFQERLVRLDRACSL